jgi:hypothetical protein
MRITAALRIRNFLPRLEVARLSCLLLSPVVAYKLCYSFQQVPQHAIADPCSCESYSPSQHSCTWPNQSCDSQQHPLVSRSKREQDPGLGLPSQDSGLDGHHWNPQVKTAAPVFFSPCLSISVQHCQITLKFPFEYRRLCSVGARDYAAKTSENIDLTVVDHGGLHLVFEAEGEANPIDSPSVLYVTDVDSECEVKVGEMVLKKGERTRLKPGTTIEMGEEASYVVLRNVHAHA